MYAGDYTLEDNIIIPFTTRAFSSGVPTALVSGVVDIYEGITATPIITAETLTVSIGSQAGFNAITIDATAAAGFEVGKTYTAILDAGTVDSVSVVGEVIAWFTIGQSAAAIDLANATDGLTALKTVIDLIPTTAMRGTDDALLAADISLTGGAVDTVTTLTNLPSIPTNWLTATGINAGALDGKGNWNIGKGGYALTTANWNVGKSGYSLTTADWNVGKAGYTAAPTAGSIAAASFAAGAIDADALNADAVDKIRDGLLPTQNAAFNNIEFLFVDSTDHVTPVTGAGTMTVTRSIDGGAFGSGTGTGPAEVGNGIYQYDASAADMNGGVITFRFAATSGTPNAPDDTFLTIITGGGV